MNSEDKALTQQPEPEALIALEVEKGDGSKAPEPDWLCNIDIDEFERLSGMNYSPKELAMYFAIPWIPFKKYFYSYQSKLDYHYKRGVLLCKAKSSLKMQQDSESGDNMPNAIRFDRKQYEEDWKRTLDEVCYGDI